MKHLSAHDMLLSIPDRIRDVIPVDTTLEIERLTQDARAVFMELEEDYRNVIAANATLEKKLARVVERNEVLKRTLASALDLENDDVEDR